MTQNHIIPNHLYLPLWLPFIKRFNCGYNFLSKPAPSVTTTKTSEMTVSSPITRTTLLALEKTTPTGKLTSTIEGSSREGGSKDERKQPPGKGDAAK